MRCPALPLLLSIAAAVPAGAALAQQTADMTRMRFIVTKERAPEPPPFKPYAAVMVEPPEPSREAGLNTFREAVAAVAKSRVYSELERIVTAQGFFWDRDFGGTFNRRQPGVDNLAAAVRLEHGNGTGWIALERLAAEATADALAGRPGVFCAPAEPRFDGIAFDRLLDVTHSRAHEWVYPREEGALVYAAPEPSAAVIELLGRVLVRVLEPAGKDGETGADRAWVRVATPNGKVGYVAPDTLRTLAVERLCYGKDGFGRWWIAGYVGGPN